MKIRSDVFGYAGIALFALAVVVRLAVIGSDAPALGLAVLGAVFLLVYLARAELSVERFLSRRSTRMGGGVFGTTVFLLGIAVIVNLLAFRIGWSVDVTRDRLFTLAPETIAALRECPVPPEVWVFHPENSAEALRLEGLLEAARDAEPRLRFHMVDPARDPVETARFELHTYGTVVQVGDRTDVFPGTDEEEFLSSLLRVSRPGRIGVGFLEGHGERSFAGPQPEEYRRAAEALSRRGYRPFSLDLLRGDGLDSVDVVVLTGPQTPLTPAEVETLAAYLGRGGRILALLDPASPVDLSTLLEPLGIRFTPALLVDPDQREPGVVYPTEYAPHPILRSLEQRRIQVVFPGVGEVAVGASQPGLRSMALLRSGRRTRVVDRVGSEPRSRSLGGAVEQSREGAPPTRVVVLGDVDFAANRTFDVLGNGDLFLNSIQWLADRESWIELRPRASTDRPVLLSRQQGRALMVVVVGLLPLGVVAAGFAAWWKRR
jgi:ABC-type uncharacterized transport system involved in gliding motility auxiliary subunit